LKGAHSTMEGAIAHSECSVSRIHFSSK